MTREDEFTKYSKHQIDALNSGEFEKIFRELAYINPLYYHGYTNMKESIRDLNELDNANEEVYNDDNLIL